ncbi:hypothetical protein ACFWMG_44720 [Streptomyces sp. NPDC127074]
MAEAAGSGGSPGWAEWAWVADMAEVAGRGGTPEAAERAQAAGTA